MADTGDDDGDVVGAVTSATTSASASASPPSRKRSPGNTSNKALDEILQIYHEKAKRELEKKEAPPQAASVQRMVNDNAVQMQNEGSLLLSANDLPERLRKHPMFVFAKQVCGRMGISNIDEMFEMKALRREMETITLLDLDCKLVSAITKADGLIKRISAASKRIPLSWSKEIIVFQISNGAVVPHPLYDAFIDLVADYMCHAISKRPRAGITSSRAMTNVLREKEWAEDDFVAAYLEHVRPTRTRNY